MEEALSTLALVGLLAGAVLLLRPAPCPRCGSRALRFEESGPWFGRDRCGRCGWESEPYSVDI
jgi:hypothetical protein